MPITGSSSEPMVRARARHRRAERGQILILFAVVVPVLAAMVALMVDIGGAAITYHRAQVALDAAAFAAAQAIDLDALDHTQTVQLDPYLAGQLAGQYASLNSRGQLQIVSFYIDRDTVFATGQMVYRPLLAGAVGIDTVTARVVSSATAGFGIATPGE